MFSYFYFGACLFADNFKSFQMSFNLATVQPVVRCNARNDFDFEKEKKKTLMFSVLHFYADI